MLKSLPTCLLGAFVVALLVASTAIASVDPGPEPMPGQSRADALPSPRALLVHGSNGYTIVISAPEVADPADARVQVGVSGPLGTVYYSASANTSGEGIRANLGRYGRIDLRWIPDQRVREVTGRCPSYRTHVYFVTGSYVGTLRFRGGGDFSEVRRRRVVWKRSWYGEHLDCLRHISEGFPGPGAILEAGGAANTERPRFDIVTNGAGQEVEYFASQRERVGHVLVSRNAFGTGGPRTLHFIDGFRSAEVSPPEPFSGSARFVRREHARGTWRGDLSVDFPDRSGVHLAGKSFEAIFHSGYHEEGFLISAR